MPKKYPSFILHKNNKFSLLWVGLKYLLLLSTSSEVFWPEMAEAKNTCFCYCCYSQKNTCSCYCCYSQNKQWLHCRKKLFLIVYMVRKWPSWFIKLVISCLHWLVSVLKKLFFIQWSKTTTCDTIWVNHPKLLKAKARPSPIK